MEAGSSLIRKRYAHPANPGKLPRRECDTVAIQTDGDSPSTHAQGHSTNTALEVGESPAEGRNCRDQPAALLFASSVGSCSSRAWPGAED